MNNTSNELGRIGAVLKKNRTQCGLSIDTICEKTGIIPSRLIDFETSKALPSLEQLQKLASMFHTTIAALFLETDAKIYSMPYKDRIKDHKLANPIPAKFAIGDWSGDGHRESDDVIFQVNYPICDIQDAYKESCKLTGVQFNHGKNYSTPNGEYAFNQILTEYGEPFITPEQTAILKKFHVITDEIINKLRLREIDDNEFIVDDVKQFVTILIRFISLSMPDDFVASHVNENRIPYINGHGSDLNVQFGYGIY